MSILALDIELSVSDEKEWIDFKQGKIWADLSNILGTWLEDAIMSLKLMEKEREDDLIAKSRIQTLEQVLGIVDIISETLAIEKEDKDG